MIVRRIEHDVYGEHEEIRFLLPCSPGTVGTGILTS